MESDNEILGLLTNKLIRSPEFNQHLIGIIDQRLRLMQSTPEYLTRSQLAELWKVSKQTIDRMTEEALAERGFKKVKIGVSVRFEILKKV